MAQFQCLQLCPEHLHVTISLCLSALEQSITEDSLHGVWGKGDAGMGSTQGQAGQGEERGHRAENSAGNQSQQGAQLQRRMTRGGCGRRTCTCQASTCCRITVERGLGPGGGGR